MSVFNILVTIGITAILGAFIYIGRKLQILESLQETTGKIKANVKVISDHLIRTSSNFDHTELEAYSPLTLTESGEKLIKTLGFDNVFAQYKNDFFSFIDHENPKQKYDVELSAIKSVSAFSDNDYMGFLKKFFYNNPSRNLQNTAPTLGVYIRDKYLEKHPEVTD